MSTATFTQTSNAPARNYFVDVSNAVRALAAALFAAQERQFVAQEVKVQPTTERALAKSRMKLFSMANKYQQSAPNLSAELRAIACRD